MDLRSAIDNQEIVPWFQPIVDLRTGLLSGFEVLPSAVSFFQLSLSRWLRGQPSLGR
jgi:predicted signal transduction protein with EAL and GGDEF domain